MRKIKCDYQTAVKRLRARYAEQVERFPLMRRDIPLQKYIAANVRDVQENDLLQRYERL